MKPIIKDSFPEYYIEAYDELEDIPTNAPAGTVVQCNASTGFKVYMKMEDGTFNEL